MRWTVHGERTLYDSPWVRLALADVEVPGGRRFEHHVVRSTAPAAGVVVDDGDRVLLLHRHRFITGRWGWEVPAGRVDPGEALVEAAAREAQEETGWRPGRLEPLTHYHPVAGLGDTTFHLFRADGATHVGNPSDPSESERVAWLPWARVRQEVAGGGIGDGLSLTALLWCLALR